ncbi:unnamed protein product [Prunus armeniaca]|uniref:Uncharacterized protein n=1 Tax=Prunus armeniaca TaxID=36596 RepID=A0A6J5XD09_PRUAR|nr:unnamed protein product [Prunus armeniaca]
MDDHSTAVFKPVYKSFKFKCSEAIKGLKVEKNTGLKDNNVFISNLKSEDSEVVSNQHPDDSRNMHAVRNASRASGYMDWKDSVDGNGQHIPHYTCTCSDKEESRERKVGMDNELPELVAFLQESSNYQCFKDICIDKEVPSQEKYLVENCELDHSRIACILDSDLDSSSESIGETLDSESSASTEHDTDKDVNEQCGSKNLKTEDDKYFGESDDHSTKKTVSETLLIVRQGPNNAVLANSMVLSKSQAIDDNSRTSKASVRSDLDDASSLGKLNGIITIDDGREEVTQSAECHPPDIGNMFRPDSSEDGMSASEPCSGLLALSGGIPSCGSISLRSNSSTTSSQSFAFPILSSEWNGSPARMGKADPRQLQRHHRHWVMRFLCWKSRRSIGHKTKAHNHDSHLPNCERVPTSNVKSKSMGGRQRSMVHSPLKSLMAILYGKTHRQEEGSIFRLQQVTS